MRELTVQSLVTLDGVAQAPGGPDEDPTGGFEHGGWSVGYWDDAMMQVMGDSMSAPFDLLLGRKTYEIFAAHWPFAGDEPLAAQLNGATKHVASRTLRDLAWQNSRLIEGDLGAAVRKLKQADGPALQVLGSINLVQSLLPTGLIDAYHLWIFPVVVGNGKRLFGDGAMPSGLTLAETRPSSTGVVMNTYRPAGPIKAGSFALEEPTPDEVVRRRKMAEG